MTGRGVNCEAEDRRLRSKVRCPAPDVRRLRSAILLPSKAMSSRLGRWLRDPLFLLCVTAGLLAFVVQSGELGSADTMHRLQTTHWLWTSQPQVFPNEYPEFGLHGRGGKLYSWYGIGQSLLMLPADLVGTWIASWHIFSDYEDDPAVRSIIVSYSTNILVTVLTVLIVFRFLAAVAIQRERIGGGRSGVAFLHHAPALHTEHDGEQLHHAADALSDCPFSTSGCGPTASGRCLLGRARWGSTC